MRLTALLLLGASIAALVAAPSWWLLTRHDPSAGSLADLGLESLPATPSAATGSPRSSSRPAAERLAEQRRPRPALVLPVRRARVDDLRVRRGPIPVSLRIPALGVAASVVPVGVEAETGEMELPPDNSTVGWYRHGAAPGRGGPAVLAGHVDYGDGEAVFFRLGELEPGDRVVVGYRNGARQAFRVVARRVVGKDDLPPRIFAREGRPVLTLVTCGGAYDADRRRYLGNTLVFALPVGVG